MAAVAAGPSRDMQDVMNNRLAHMSPASTATDSNSPVAGQPPPRVKKGVQQDEVDISDETEVAAANQRRRPRASATSRAALGAPPMSAHGAHYSARVVRPMSPGKAQRLAAQTARRRGKWRARLLRGIGHGR